MKNRKFRSPFWILAFAGGQYIASIISLMAMSIALSIDSIPAARLLQKINIVLSQPFLNSLTMKFISEHLSGPKGHLVFVLNAIAWGVAIWVVIQIIKKRKPNNRIERTTDSAP